VRFLWLSAPRLSRARREGDRACAPSACISACPTPPGRQQVEPIENSHFVQPASLVIKALGFDPEDMPAMFDEPALPVTRWGTIQVDFRTQMTSLPGVFAGGDIVRGASLVVWGIRDGRDAAERIEAYVLGRESMAMAAE
jgi:glutamate synthase (NADPH/NADH) small chain